MKITEIPAKPKEQKQIRVAAYARVSSDKDAAFHSLEAQKVYYEEYVSSHADWVLVDLYSDNGISGTKIERPEFQRMLNDCRDGKIDLIVTKSITRFARNTVVLLETIRELKKLGVDCYFEKENMHSISPDGELLLTLLAMYAEEEARSASENQRWRIHRRFENGEPWVGNMLGYRLVDGKMVVVPEEAKIVRIIFDSFLSGMGYIAIAKLLNSFDIPSPTGTKWTRATIGKILANEKYTGNMYLQKSYRPDFRTKVDKRNHGEVRKYYVEDSHEAIITAEQFQAVQEEIERRREKYCSNRNPNHTHTELFTGLIYCEICGGKYQRKYTNAKKYDRPVWICHRLNSYGVAGCASQKIPENILIEKTSEVLEVESLTREIIEARISKIVIPEHFHIRYELTDGETVDVYWKHPSRSLSWTDEMRKEASERNKARRRKEENHDA